MTRLQSFYSAAAGISALAALGLWQLHAREVQPKTAAAESLPAPAAPVAEEPAWELTLAEAIAHPEIDVEFRGNGRERLTISYANRAEGRFRVEVSAGETFSSGDSTVVVLRATELELGGEKVSRTVITAAVNTTASVSDRTYAPSAQVYPRLRPLLAHLAEHPEISAATAQTAVLALTENLPVCAFAKFATAGGDMAEVFETDDFRVEVSDMIGALALLRQLGIPDQEIALSIDPQLRIEAMIDTLAHASAMRYYGIAADREWDFWKLELTQGDIRTRHYALFGIARFFPEVALKMLPDWARQTRTNLVFRETALTALAETQRPAAVAVLRQLQADLGPDTALGQTAGRCLAALQARLDQEANQKVAVAFRTQGSLAKF